MPYSDTSFDQKVKEILVRKKFKKYLDIGPGAGKYGRIIRNNIIDGYIEAVEVDRSYVRRFNLKKLYDKIYISPIEKFFDKRMDYTTDVVIIGDCIEHLKKSDGIDLLNFLIYRTKLILVVYPKKVVQYTWEGHRNEAHRSVWDENDFKQFKTTSFHKKFMTLTVITGYLDDKEAVFVK